MTVTPVGSYYEALHRNSGEPTHTMVLVLAELIIVAGGWTVVADFDYGTVLVECCVEPHTTSSGKSRRKA